MNLALKHKKVFVAGSSRGIGKAIAVTFIAEGADVAICGRNEKALTETRKQIQPALAFTADLSRAADRKQLYIQIRKKFKKLDALILNVGNGNQKPGLVISAADWQKSLEENFFTSVHTTQTFLPLVKPGGSLTFIGSIASLQAMTAPLTYRIAKYAINNYALNLALELAVKNIRVNVVSPGNILFPGGRWAEKMRADKKHVMQYIRNAVPLGRFGKADEVADLIVFLSSERAQFITGANFIIDGGQLKRIY